MHTSQFVTKQYLIAVVTLLFNLVLPASAVAPHGSTQAQAQGKVIYDLLIIIITKAVYIH